MSNGPFRIAVASGKGGTGKTTLAVALALAHAQGGGSVQLLDCDVEEPDTHLFLPVSIEQTDEVTLPVPVVNADRCDLCVNLERPRCREVCAFGALTVLPGGVMVFPALCHACGACVTLCPRGALEEEPRAIGVVEEGHAGPIHFVQGRLNIGEPRANDVIRAVQARTRPDGLVILDAPPGVACPVVETIRVAQAVLLVTEPTPFGLHDLELAAELCARMEKPAAVILNRSDLGDGRVEAFCERAGLPLLLRIPHERAIAEGLAHGIPLTEIRPDLVPALGKVLTDLRASSAREEVRT